MTGQEMLLQQALKFLGVKPETIEATFAEIRGLGVYAKSVDARLTAIETNQKRILELLEQSSGVVPSSPLAIEHVNGD